MNKDKAKFTFNLTEGNRHALAQKGFIQYKTGKSLLKHGEFGEYLNNLIMRDMNKKNPLRQFLINKIKEKQMDLRSVENEIAGLSKDLAGAVQLENMEKVASK